MKTNKQPNSKQRPLAAGRLSIAYLNSIQSDALHAVKTADHAGAGRLYRRLYVLEADRGSHWAQFFKERAAMEEAIGKREQL